MFLRAKVRRKTCLIYLQYYIIFNCLIAPPKVLLIFCVFLQFLLRLKECLRISIKNLKQDKRNTDIPFYQHQLTLYRVSHHFLPLLQHQEYFISVFFFLTSMFQQKITKQVIINCAYFNSFETLWVCRREKLKFSTNVSVFAYPPKA